MHAPFRNVDLQNFLRAETLRPPGTTLHGEGRCVALRGSGAAPSQGGLSQHWQYFFHQPSQARISSLRVTPPMAICVRSMRRSAQVRPSAPLRQTPHSPHCRTMPLVAKRSCAHFTGGKQRLLKMWREDGRSASQQTQRELPVRRGRLGTVLRTVCVVVGGVLCLVWVVCCV